jgi:hypothetical protein
VGAYCPYSYLSRGIKNNATPTAINTAGHHTRNTSTTLKLSKPKLLNKKATPTRTSTIAAKLPFMLKSLVVINYYTVDELYGASGHKDHKTILTLPYSEAAAG